MKDHVKRTSLIRRNKCAVIILTALLAGALSTGPALAADADWKKVATRKMRALEQRIGILYEARMKQDSSSYPEQQDYTTEDFKEWLGTLETETTLLLSHFDYLAGGPYCENTQYVNMPGTPVISQIIYDPITEVRENCRPFRCDIVGKRCKASCYNSSDCVPGYICDGSFGASGYCIRPH